MFLFDNFFYRSQTEMSDFWEVKYEQILLSEALGEGAFGKVYKGSLVAMPPQPVGKKISSRRPRSIRRKKPEAEETTVAIKMLHSSFSVFTCVSVCLCV